MDEGKEEQEFPQGLLAHLELLEFRDRGRQRQRRLQERRQNLERKIRDLRRRRDRIREQLRAAELGNSGRATAPDPREIVEWKIRNCRERLRLYRLTGVSGRLCPQGGISFSLHSAFQGSLLDSFDVELQPCREFREFREFRECWELRLRRHSIPPFLPMEALARQFLPHNPGQLLGILLQHLNAFVARREQLRQLQEEFGDWILGVPSGNSLCNLLSFCYRIPPREPQNSQNSPQNSQNSPGEFRARLCYRDPLRSLPSDVIVTARRGAVSVPEHSELFRSLPLGRALREIQTR